MIVLGEVRGVLGAYHVDHLLQEVIEKCLLIKKKCTFNIFDSFISTNVQRCLAVLRFCAHPTAIQAQEQAALEAFIKPLVITY